MKSKIRLAVVDLELTCDDKRPFELEEHEIIEIGICLCDLSDEGMDIISLKQIFVRPIINSKLTQFCIDLTGIHQRTVDQAKPLAEVIPELEEWLSENKVFAWCSWGNDKKMFITECQTKHLENPMEKFQHVDLKRIFTQQFGWRVGMTRALSLRGIAAEGKLHSAVDDARNVAKLIKYETLLRENVLNSLICS